MKHTAGLLIPVLMLVFGAYALFTALGSTGEQVALLSDQQIPRGLGLMFGLLGLGGGGMVLVTALSNRKHAA
jgi:uncharacterized membrane protein YedE/YeeE